MLTVALLANVEPGTPLNEWPWVATAVNETGEIVFTSGPPSEREDFDFLCLDAVEQFVNGVGVE